MWKSGAARVRRHGVLAELVANAARAGSYADPWARTPRIWESYASEGEILRDLYQQWRIELAGAVFTAIERGRGDLAADVASAYAEMITRRRHVKRILDAHDDHPAIADAVRKERSLLGAALGDAALPAAA